MVIKMPAKQKTASSEVTWSMQSWRDWKWKGVTQTLNTNKNVVILAIRQPQLCDLDILFRRRGRPQQRPTGLTDAAAFKNRGLQQKESLQWVTQHNLIRKKEVDASKKQTLWQADQQHSLRRWPLSAWPQKDLHQQGLFARRTTGIIFDHFSGAGIAIVQIFREKWQN